jgi:hypothetical protein
MLELERDGEVFVLRMRGGASTSWPSGTPRSIRWSTRPGPRR